MKKKTEQTTMSTENMSFEEALAGLEQTVSSLEHNELTLSSALVSFERGIGFMRVCEKHLRDAEGKLKELLKGENGELVERILGSASSPLDNEESNDE